MSRRAPVFSWVVAESIVGVYFFRVCDWPELSVKTWELPGAMLASKARLSAVCEADLNTAMARCASRGSRRWLAQFVNTCSCVRVEVGFCVKYAFRYVSQLP